MTPLHRAIALEQMDASAVRVGENLHFDMPRLGQILLEQHRFIAEAGLRLAPRRGQRRDEILAPHHDAHTLAAAAGRCLDQHRVADRISLPPQQRIVLPGAVIAGNERHTGPAHDRLGFGLGTHRADRFGRRTDEDQPRCSDSGGELGVFGKKPVARMDRLRTGLLRNGDDRVPAQIALTRRRRSEPVSLVAGLDV